MGGPRGPGEVSEAEARSLALALLELDWALGGGQVDTNFMVAREPALLGLGRQRVINRVATMSSVLGGADVLALVEREPRLLLRDVSVREGDTAEGLRRAWAYGLGSDRADEWEARLAELRAYAVRHGDCSAGCRPRQLARIMSTSFPSWLRR